MVVASWTCGCGYNGLREHSNLGQLETDCETVLSMGSWETHTEQEECDRGRRFIVLGGGREDKRTKLRTILVCVVTKEKVLYQV